MLRLMGVYPSKAVRRLPLSNSLRLLSDKTKNPTPPNSESSIKKDEETTRTEDTSTEKSRRAQPQQKATTDSTPHQTAKSSHSLQAAKAAESEPPQTAKSPLPEPSETTQLPQSHSSKVTKLQQPQSSEAAKLSQPKYSQATQSPQVQSSQETKPQSSEPAKSPQQQFDKATKSPQPQSSEPTKPPRTQSPQGPSPSQQKSSEATKTQSSKAKKPSQPQSAERTKPTQSKTPPAQKQPQLPQLQFITNIPAPKGVPRRPQEDNTSFVMNIFKGLLEAKHVFPYPNILKKEEKAALELLVGPINNFFQEINNSAKNDLDEQIEQRTIFGLWDLGVFALQVPIELGGLGLTNTQCARIAEIVGAHDLGVGVTLGAHQSIGFKGILTAGTAEQKAKYLPRVSKGEYAAFCLTEPSGSDPTFIRTKAELASDETHYILNGSKIWITNGDIAEIMTVFAQTPVQQPDGSVIDRLTAFIVERGFGGVTNGQPEKTMGIKCSHTTEVFFENVKVPVENVLGGVGNGFKVAMSVLNNGRCSFAASLSGSMKACISKSVKFASQREQFGQKINTFGIIQEKIARMAMLQYVTESMAYMVCANMDSGACHCQVEAAISKCFASEAAWWVCDESIQIMGGDGYMKEIGLEQIMRDLRIFRIIEGTNEVLRLFIALTGIQYAGATLKELQKAFHNPAANLGLIYGAVSKKMGQKVGLSNLNLNNLVHKDLITSAVFLARKIEDFANRIEILLIKHGTSIVNEQFILARLANSAIDIYSSAVVLSRATNSLNQNLQSAATEKLMAQVWVDEACNRVTNNLMAVRNKKSLENFNQMKSISNAVSQRFGVVQNNPLNI